MVRETSPKLVTPQSKSSKEMRPKRGMVRQKREERKRKREERVYKGEGGRDTRGERNEIPLLLLVPMVFWALCAF